MRSDNHSVVNHRLCSLFKTYSPFFNTYGFSSDLQPSSTHTPSIFYIIRISIDQTVPSFSILRSRAWPSRKAHHYLPSLDFFQLQKIFLPSNNFNIIMMPAFTMNENSVTIVVNEEMIEEARDLDRNYDLWTARMIRWVKFKISPKSLICGAEWEDQQDINHEYETMFDRTAYYMPGAPAVYSEIDMPSHCTASMSDTALYERDCQREEARQVAAKEKFDAGADLTESEQRDYDRWTGEEKSYEGPLLDPTVNEDEKVLNACLAILEEEPLNIEFDGQETEYNAWLREELTEVALESKLVVSNTSIETAEKDVISNLGDQGPSVYAVPIWHESPPSDSPSCCESEISSIYYDDNSVSGWAEEPTRTRLCWHYLNGYRGRQYCLPAGIGLHVRARPTSIATWDSIAGSDALDNIPTDLCYVFRPTNSESKESKLSKLLMIEAAPSSKDADLNLPDFYSSELCHRDNSWLANENPEVTLEMIASYQEAVARNKNVAVKTLDWLKLFGKNLELLAPMMHTIMKDSRLCQAIHAELLVRDIGFLKKDNDKQFRLHGRIETVFANLDRWARIDIGSAIEDVRLILEDHELMLEIIEALDGGETRNDRSLIRPDPGEFSCGGCGKNFEELGVLYGRDSSTLIATGCRVCEDTRLREAKKLLWNWYNNPDKISDELYKQIFSLEKGFRWPEDKN